MSELTISSYKLLIAIAMYHTHFRNVFSVVPRTLDKKISLSYALKNIKHHSKCAGFAFCCCLPFNLPFRKRCSHTWEQTSQLTPKDDRKISSSFAFLSVRRGGWLLRFPRTNSRPSKRNADGETIIFKTKNEERKNKKVINLPRYVQVVILWYLYYLKRLILPIW